VYTHAFCSVYGQAIQGQAPRSSNPSRQQKRSEFEGLFFSSLFFFPLRSSPHLWKRFFHPFFKAPGREHWLVSPGHCVWIGTSFVRDCRRLCAIIILVPLLGMPLLGCYVPPNDDGQATLRAHVFSPVQGIRPR